MSVSESLIMRSVTSDMRGRARRTEVTTVDCSHCGSLTDGRRGRGVSSPTDKLQRDSSSPPPLCTDIMIHRPSARVTEHAARYAPCPVPTVMPDHGDRSRMPACGMVMVGAEGRPLSQRAPMSL